MRSSRAVQSGDPFLSARGTYLAHESSRSFLPERTIVHNRSNNAEFLAVRSGDPSFPGQDAASADYQDPTMPDIPADGDATPSAAQKPPKAPTGQSILWYVPKTSEAKGTGKEPGIHRPYSKTSRL